MPEVHVLLALRAHLAVDFHALVTRPTEYIATALAFQRLIYKLEADRTVKRLRTITLGISG